MVKKRAGKTKAEAERHLRRLKAIENTKKNKRGTASHARA